MFGKTVSDLQSDIIVDNETAEPAISGSLNLVENYTGFSEDSELQSGHYLALHFVATEGSTVTIQLLGETDQDPITLDSSMSAVLRITYPPSETLKVTCSKDGYDSVVKVYDLNEIEFADTNIDGDSQ